jgi:hypothetical protein
VRHGAVLCGALQWRDAMQRDAMYCAGIENVSSIGFNNAALNSLPLSTFVLGL